MIIVARSAYVMFMCHEFLFFEHGNETAGPASDPSTSVETGILPKYDDVSVVIRMIRD